LYDEREEELSYGLLNTSFDGGGEGKNYKSGEGGGGGERERTKGTRLLRFNPLAKKKETDSLAGRGLSLYSGKEKGRGERRWDVL